MRISSTLLILCALAQIRQGQFMKKLSGRQLLVGYWGQNAAFEKGETKYEKPLKWFCENSKYDVLILAFMDILFIGKDRLPGLDFSHHCETPVNSSYPHLLKCPKIEEDIKFCQSVGIPILLSIGGPTGDGTLQSPARARLLAHTIWNLFLGVQNTNFAKLRTFGSVVLDGINLFIEGGAPQHYPELVRELRMLMDSDTKKTYYITGTPQCSFPDHFLGPGAGTALGDAGRYFDHLYIRFYDDSSCSTGAGEKFVESLQKWLEFTEKQQPKGPLIFVGLPSSGEASSSTDYYRSPDELATIYKSLRTKRNIGGIMLWECSWDQNNVIEGRHYSEYAKVLLIDIKSSTASQHHGITASQPPATKSSEGPIDCSLLGDGLYPHETDCSKYVLCSEGTMNEINCPPGLMFNKEKLFCDWPQNVTC